MSKYITFGLRSTLTLMFQTSCVTPAHQLRHFHVGLNYLKGHSHYQNTRHIKAAKDMVKARNSAQVALQIRIAIREGGSDPKHNGALARAIKLGDNFNLPAKSIQNMVKKASMNRGNATVFGVNGPNNSVFLIEIYMHEHFNKKIVNRTIEDAGFVLTGHLAAASHFEKKAIVVAIAENQDLTLADAEALAIECDAEDVEQLNDNPLEFQFSAEPDKLYTICKTLTQNRFDIQQSGVEYVPLTTVKISDTDKEHWTSALDTLSTMDTIDLESVHDNVEW